jgi:hypothetical protein
MANIELSNKFKKKSTVLYGLVDDDLFHNRIEKEIKDKIDNLYKQIGKEDDGKKYRERFQRILNPNSPGKVQASLYSALNGEQVQIFFTPNVVISSSVIYHQNNLDQDYEIISRYNIHEDPKFLKWFFPIFDKDDLNDMGFVSAKMAEKFSSSVAPYPDIELMNFSRFNYYIKHEFVHEENNTFFGAYANAIKNEDVTYLKKNKKLLDGLTFPDVSEIPFIYLWGDANRLTDKIIEVLNYYIIYINSIASKDLVVLKTELEIFTKFKAQLTDTTSNYSDDLISFHKCSIILAKKLETLTTTSLNEIKNFIKGVEQISKQENENCAEYCLQDKTKCDNCSTKSACKDWLEDSIIGHKRTDNIIETFKKITS